MNNLVTAEQLVLVFEAKIGDTVTQACDARTLHTYLGSKTQFADWIKSRIEKYGFQENQDFALASENSEASWGGHNRKEYHLTLDMAKELAMVENNTKGREVRQYFIAMEKKAITAATPLVVAQPSPTFIGMETRAVSALESHLKAASLFACPLHLAQSEAVKAVRDSYGVDFGVHLLSAPAQQNILGTDVMLEPTELGKRFDLSARQMNTALADRGLQVKTESGWEPTDAGMKMCTRHHWVRGNKTGYNLKWNVALVEAATHVQH